MALIHKHAVAGVVAVAGVFPLICLLLALRNGFNDGLGMAVMGVGFFLLSIAVSVPAIVFRVRLRRHHPLLRQPAAVATEAAVLAVIAVPVLFVVRAYASELL
jgi:hypothetical protein